MTVKRVGYPGLIPYGTQVMSLSNSTAGTPNASLLAAHLWLLSVETNAVRFWADGTPTLTTGVLLATGKHEITGVCSDWAPRFQRSTGAAKVTIQGFRYEAA